MTIATLKDVVFDNGDGISLIYTFTEKIFDATHLLVKITDKTTKVTTTQVRGGAGTFDYTVIVESDFSKATITFNTAPTTNEDIELRRIVPVTQLTAYVKAGAFPAASHERALDLLTMIVQQIDAKSDRAFQFGPDVADIGNIIIAQNVADRKEKQLVFDSIGDLVLGTIPAGTVLPVSETDPSLIKDKLTSNFIAAHAIQERKNKLINGGFDVWQRGTNFSGVYNDVYNTDRWRGLSNTDDTYVVTRQTFALGQTDVPGSPEFFVRIAITAGSTGTFSHFRQGIEFLLTLAGEPIATSFYAKASVNVIVDTRYEQGFGTGGSPSGPAVTVPKPHSLTTSWQRFTAQDTLPSLSGKTLGTDGNDHVDLILLLPLNTTVNIDFAIVQTEKGSVATLFEKLSFLDTALLCQSYFFKSFAYDVAPAQNVGFEDALVYRADFAGVHSQQFTWEMPTTMGFGGDPTIVFFNPAAANANWRNQNAGADSGAAQLNIGSKDWSRILNPQVAGDLVGDDMRLHITAESEI